MQHIFSCPTINSSAFILGKMMYALGVSFLLATSHAFAPMGGRVQTRMGKLSMSTVASPVATEAILATVSFFSPQIFTAQLGRRAYNYMSD